MVDFILISPELFVLGMSCVVLLADLFLSQKRQRFNYMLTQITLVVALLISVSLYLHPNALAFNGMFIHDPARSLLKITIYITSILVFSLTYDYLNTHEIPKAEFYLLGLFSILGILVALSAQHFLSLYLGLESMSLPTYALVALYRNSAKATEAAIKYFVQSIGVLRSGMLLYGLSMLYGATNSLDWTKVHLQLFIFQYYTIITIINI
jgi:NADH-quinone oxidoreductase subunit N